MKCLKLLSALTCFAHRYGAQPQANALDPGPGHVDVFRDFEAEAEAAKASSSTPRSQAAAADAAKSARLADLFKAPQHLLFVGSFEAAKAQALQKGQWLLVNVQSNNEFASHQLNRDTWGNELVQQVVKGMAVVWQVYDTASEGQKVLAAYKWAALPVIAIVDPITGEGGDQGGMGPGVMGGGHGGGNKMGEALMVAGGRGARGGSLAIARDGDRVAHCLGTSS